MTATGRAKCAGAKDTQSPWTSSPHTCSVFVMNEDDEKTIKRAFGERVRDVRKDRGLSQEALALACALDRTYIGGVERGERNISLINIYKIAKALDQKPAELFK